MTPPTRSDRTTVTARDRETAKALCDAHKDSPVNVQTWCTTFPLEDEIASALAAERERTIEECAARAEGKARVVYGEDIFPPTSTSTDAKSADLCRRVLRFFARDLREERGDPEGWP